MGAELEAAGAAVAAGLVASAIDGNEARAGESQAKCPNCGAELVGQYCHGCGQPAHIHRSLGHLFEEALHGLVHFDAKAWRTLPRLAFRPGTLTRDYIEGKRARYISPLALFLFTIFLMFFVFAMIGPALVKVDPTALNDLKGEIEVAQDRREERTAAHKPVLGANSPGVVRSAVLGAEERETWQETWRDMIRSADFRVLGSPQLGEKL